MLTYTIDSGNTFVKIAIFKDSDLIDIKRLNTHDFHFEFERDSRIIISNVSHDIISKLPAQAVDASKLIKDFKSTYDQSTLGIDRKVISYYLQRKGIDNALIVDAGSFITFDEIRNGIHKGGAIYLGLQNYLKSYPTFSANLPLLESENIEEGCANTKQAISFAYKAYLSMIQNELQRFDQHEVYLTGGDAKLISSGQSIKDNLIHEALFSLQDLI